MIPQRTAHLLISICLITAPGCTWLPSHGGREVDLNLQPGPVDLRYAAPQTPSIPPVGAQPGFARSAATSQSLGAVTPSPMLDGTQPSVPPAQSNQFQAQATSRPVAPDTEISAFTQELAAASHIDEAERNQILAAALQTPPQFQSQMIRQYRALLALGRTAQATPPTTTPQPTSLPSAVPPPADLGVAAEIPVVAATHNGPIKARETTAKAGNKTDLQSEFEAFYRERQSNQVEAAAYTTASDQPDEGPTAERDKDSDVLPGNATWEQLVDSAIKKLEASRERQLDSDVREEDEARLRMLYLTADRRDDAVRRIPSLEPEMQEFWSKQFFGLATLLNSELISDRSNRLIEAKRNLDEALRRLGESSPLFVRNVAFVTAVQSYGAYTPFDEYEFRPGTPVLLYAEVENYRCKETARGYHTDLRSSYEIFDSRHQKVAEHEFSTNEEYCKNARRDFFTVCEFRMPEKLTPGKYDLRLTVADLNGNKAGETSITFHIRGEFEE